MGVPVEAHSIVAGLPQMKESDMMVRARVKKKARLIAKQMEENSKLIQETTSTYWKSGLWVVFVVGSIALYFVYEDVLGKNKVIFGALVIVLAVALLGTLGRKVKETGAAAAGGTRF